MPPKWDRCVSHLQDKGYKGGSPYAICTVSTGLTRRSGKRTKKKTRSRK